MKLTTLMVHDAGESSARNIPAESQPH